MTSERRQLSLVDYVEELEQERREADRRTEDRRERRAFLVFATNPARAGQDDYKLVFATEARTQAEAEAKVRDVAGEGRRLAAYLASGKYKDQLPEARWVA